MLSAEMHRENPEAIREGSYGRFLYNFYRTYDPNTGRYLEADPIGQNGGVNLYAYGLNNAINAIDPFGLQNFGGPIFQGEDPGKPLYSPAVKPKPPSPYELYEQGFDVANKHPLSNPDPNKDNPFENKFRHCYTSCTLTRHHSTPEAWVGGKLNEWLTGESDPLSGECTPDSEVDQESNATGRELGRHAKSDADCATGCASMSQ
jgi:RHS repeat-associated protein